MQASTSGTAPSASLALRWRSSLRRELGMIPSALGPTIMTRSCSPLSNVALRSVGSLADHVLPAMLADGLKATVNSDDPAYFGGYIDANLAAARSEMRLSGQQIITLARNSFDACFSTQEQRDRWKAELETVAAQAPESAGSDSYQVA